MGRRLAILTSGVVLVAICHGGLVFAKSRAKYTIKLATLAPEGSTWMRYFHKMNAEVMAKTDGQVAFKAYPGGVLGDEKDVMRKIRIGQVHGGGFTGLGMGYLCKDMLLAASPLFIRNYDEADHLLEKMGDDFRRGLEASGYVLLGWQEVGFVYLFSRRPVRSVSDLRRMKLWTWEGDPVAHAFFAEARLSPIPLAVPDVLTGLQTGLVDTVYSSHLGAIALQWFTKVKYITDQPITYGLGGVVVHRKRMFNRIPARYQGMLKEIAGRHLRQILLKTREDNAKSVEVMKKRGLTIVQMTPEGLREFQELCQKATRRMFGKVFSEAAYRKAEAYLREYRSKSGK